MEFSRAEGFLPGKNFLSILNQRRFLKKGLIAEDGGMEFIFGVQEFWYNWTRSGEKPGNISGSNENGQGEGMKAFILMGLVVLLAACTPAISKDSLKMADPTLTFPMLVKDPESYRGKNILVGGQILATNARDGETWVEVLQKPLDWQHEPKDTDESYGRFLVRFSGFADPAIYSPGKKITFLGEVEGKKVQRLREMDYTYPVLIPREHHLWKPEADGGSQFHFGIGVGVTR
jgi:outer membrane lipoprotein